MKTNPWIPVRSPLTLWTCSIPSRPTWSRVRCIWNVIGRRPILAADNSNGDLPMLTLADGTSLPALRLLLIHDDADREVDYVAGDENVTKAVETHGWMGLSIRCDWQKVFPG